MPIPRRSLGVLTATLVAAALVSPIALAAPAKDRRTTTRLEVSDRQAVLGQTVTFTATVSASGGVLPDGSVTFVSNDVVLGAVTLGPGGVATLVISALPLGNHKVAATFSPQGPFEPSDDHVVMHVRLIQTTIVVSATPSPSVFGQPVTFTATVSSPVGVPTGTVTFVVDGAVGGMVAVDANGIATLILSGVLQPGDHVITALFTATVPYQSSESAPLAHAVTVRASTTTVMSAPNPSIVGDPVTFTATVSTAGGGAPTGTVTFIVDGTVHGTVQLDASGHATLITNVLELGTHTVTAQFTSADPGVLSSESAPSTHVVRSGRIIVAGTDSSVAHVKVFDATTQGLLFSFLPYGGFTGGVRVAAGDVNGDGAYDVVTAPAGGPSHVQVFDGRTLALRHSFFAFDPSVVDVSVAAGDVNGDGMADIIVSAAANGHVKVFDGATLAEIRSFPTFPASFVPLHLATGDFDGDSSADIVVGHSVVPHVKVFSGATLAELRSFLAYPGFTGGVYVAAGDVTGDGIADIITGAGAGATHVKVFDGTSNAERASFFAYGGFTGGVRVASGDVNDDGLADIITAPAGAVPHVKIFNGGTLAELASFLAFETAIGVFVGGQ